MHLLFTRMTSQVVQHVAFGTEMLVAAVGSAGEWSFIAVNPHMDLKILFLTKAFCAGRNRTLVWLSTAM